MKASHAIFAVIMVFSAFCYSCGRTRVADPLDSLDLYSEPAPWDLIEDEDYKKGNPLPVAELSNEAHSDTVAADSTMQAVLDEDVQRVLDSIPAMPAERISRYNRIGRLGDIFNDSNKYQYAVAEKIGIHPIQSMVDAYYINKRMVEIKTNGLYDVDTLKHSMPYLVPEAARLLDMIGRNFADSLKKRNAAGHRFRVTSVLRTDQSVKRLRRVNVNATDSSTHKFGTTFDISYARFNYYGKDTRLSDEELKYILAEVLRDLRRQKKCMVKFERKTPCFHITATGR